MTFGKTITALAVFYTLSANALAQEQKPQGLFVNSTKISLHETGNDSEIIRTVLENTSGKTYLHAHKSRDMLDVVVTSINSPLVSKYKNSIVIEGVDPNRDGTIDFVEISKKIYCDGKVSDSSFVQIPRSDSAVFPTIFKNIDELYRTVFSTFRPDYTERHKLFRTIMNEDGYNRDAAELIGSCKDVKTTSNK